VHKDFVHSKEGNNRGEISRRKKTERKKSERTTFQYNLRRGLGEGLGVRGEMRAGERTKYAATRKAVLNAYTKGE